MKLSHSLRRAYSLWQTVGHSLDLHVESRRLLTSPAETSCGAVASLY